MKQDGSLGLGFKEHRGQKSDPFRVPNFPGLVQSYENQRNTLHLNSVQKKNEKGV